MLSKKSFCPTLPYMWLSRSTYMGTVSRIYSKNGPLDCKDEGKLDLCVRKLDGRFWFLASH